MRWKEALRFLRNNSRVLGAGHFAIGSGVVAVGSAAYTTNDLNPDKTIPEPLWLARIGTDNGFEFNIPTLKPTTAKTVVTKALQQATGFEIKLTNDTFFPQTRISSAEFPERFFYLPHTAEQLVQILAGEERKQLLEQVQLAFLEIILEETLGTNIKLRPLEYLPYIKVEVAGTLGFHLAGTVPTVFSGLTASEHKKTLMDNIRRQFERLYTSEPSEEPQQYSKNRFYRTQPSNFSENLPQSPTTNPRI